MEQKREKKGFGLEERKNKEVERLIGSDRHFYFRQIQERGFWFSLIKE